jgi:hypothetical protein
LFFSFGEKITNFLPIRAGLPDGVFSNQKSQFGYIIESLGFENVGIGASVMAIWNRYVFMAIWKICGHLPFSILPLLVFCTKKKEKKKLCRVVSFLTSTLMAGFLGGPVGQLQQLRLLGIGPVVARLGLEHFLTIRN